MKTIVCKNKVAYQKLMGLSFVNGECEVSDQVFDKVMPVLRTFYNCEELVKIKKPAEPVQDKSVAGEPSLASASTKK